MKEMNNKIISEILKRFELKNNKDFVLEVVKYCGSALKYASKGVKNDKEVVGTLLGFDDFVNMVLDDVVEYESTSEGRRVTRLDQILLNGNNITMLVPGGEGPEGPQNN